MKIEIYIFICFCYRLSVSFHKIGGGSGLKISETSFQYFVLLSPFAIFAFRKRNDLL